MEQFIDYWKLFHDLFLHLLQPEGVFHAVDVADENHNLAIGGLICVAAVAHGLRKPEQKEILHLFPYRVRTGLHETAVRDPGCQGIKFLKDVEAFELNLCHNQSGMGLNIEGADI